MEIEIEVSFRVLSVCDKLIAWATTLQVATPVASTFRFTGFASIESKTPRPSQCVPFREHFQVPFNVLDGLSPWKVTIVNYRIVSCASPNFRCLRETSRWDIASQFFHIEMSTSREVSPISLSFFFNMPRVILSYLLFKPDIFLARFILVALFVFH